jgi:4-amino-4-deoxy-L-arabinose transferase-like glycosyltransferase
MHGKEPGAGLACWLLAAVTLACLLPFLGKAFHMDDPLFIWTARHIQSHPVDFYGFSVDWGFEQTPMTLAMQNPPLGAYYLAAVGAALGWSERALHFGYLGPALALVLGTYCMARRFCAHAFAAALATVTSPVFLLSSTSLMCDTMMAALWVWAVYFWMEGLEGENPWRLLLAATLIGACSLTKYFGVCLIPLLAVYSALQRGRAGRWLFYFLWPVLILAAYQWLSARLYGRGLLSDAVGLAVVKRTSTGFLSRIIETLAFSGGCFFIVLPALPLLWGRKGLIRGVLGAGVVGGLMVAMKKVGNFPIVEGGHVNWLFLLQMSLFVVGGALTLALAVADARRNRTPASILLLLWVAGVLVFVGAVNWTVSGRNILPMAPAAAVLIVRRLEFRQAGGLERLWWPLGLSLAVALMVAWADWRLAGLAREVARNLTSQLAPRFHDIAFEGHWGFQYYMEQLGVEPFTRNPLVLKPNQVIVVPLGNTSLFRLPDNLAGTNAEYNFTPAKWLCVQNSRAGAGYYSDGWGPIPFVFGPAPPETYLVVRVK